MANPDIGRVRGKFVVNSILLTRGSRPPKSGESGWQPTPFHTVKMSPVMGGSKEDNSFAEATPSGALELSITNPDTVGFFELDKAYYLDFTPAS